MSDMQRQALKALRSELGASQETFGQMSGLSPSYIAAVETGRRSLSLEAIATITDAVPLTGRQRQALHKARNADRASGTVAERPVTARVTELEQRLASLEDRLVAVETSKPERSIIHLRAADADTLADPGERSTRGRSSRPSGARPEPDPP